MKTTRATVVLAAAAALLQALACAAATAPVPGGFGIVERKATTPATWSVMSGESPNVTERNVIERTCAMKRSIGATTSTPVFEAGTDRPDRVEITQITSAAGWASYETIHGTVCDPASMDASHDLCGCTFRDMTSRFVHIRKPVAGATEFIDVDLAKGTGTRRLHAPAPPAQHAAPDAGLFGPVVGHDVVAGVACSVHRQDLGTGRTERCLADPADGVPAPLHYQELAKTMYLLGPDGATRRDWRRTDRIDTEAEVDLGVFDAPTGVALRTIGPAPHKP